MVEIKQEPRVMPSPDETNSTFIDEAMLSEIQNVVLGCEACSEGLKMTFRELLDIVLGSDPNGKYVISHSARCPRCDHEIRENTLVSSKLSTCEIRHFLR